MSEAEEPIQEANVVTMALAGCSILWILAAALLGAFVLALGTFACGAICDQMAMVWLAFGIGFLVAVIFCVWLFIAMIRKRISSGLLMAMLGIDALLLIALVGFGFVLGGYGF